MANTKREHAMLPEATGGWRSDQRLAPLGSFAMGIDFIRLAPSANSTELERALVIANGSDWSPQPVTLHRVLSDGTYEPLPSWFSEDYDYHMGIAVGDLTGNGFDDLVVAVFAGKDQDLSGGGVKVYLGDKSGLARNPVWLARGFAASSVALGDISGSGALDILVACLSDAGTIQKPEMGPNGELLGKARLLQNRRPSGTCSAAFRTFVLNHPSTRGCGGVCISDVDLDGTLDLVFAGQQTSVLFGRPDFSKSDPVDGLPVWNSVERHPFSFGAQAFRHPGYPDGLLVVSSRGLFCMAQLQGRTLGEVAPELLVHRPSRLEDQGAALQHLAPVDEGRPEVPAGVTVVHDGFGMPDIIAGFLDARGRDIRGANLRVFRGTGAPASEPFAPGIGERISGGGLMAGHVKAWRHQEVACPERATVYDLKPGHGGALTLPQLPAGDVYAVEAFSESGPYALASRGRAVPFTLTSDRGTLCLSEAVTGRATIVVHERLSDAVDLAASSSAAWPPAGASQVFRRSEAGSDDCASGLFRVARQNPAAKVG